MEMLCLVFPLVFVAYPRGISSSPFALSHPRPSWNKHAECNGSMNLSSCVCVCVHISTRNCFFICVHEHLFLHTLLPHPFLATCMLSHCTYKGISLLAIFATHTPNSSPHGFTPIKEALPWYSSLH